MRNTFGSSYSILGFGLRVEPPAPDPWKPDPRAREEMSTYDSLDPQVRAAFANSLYGAAVADTVRSVIHHGASGQVREVLKAKGVMPCDVGTEGVIVETVRLMDEHEKLRIRDELVS
jgi:hypothetical protein